MADQTDTSQFIPEVAADSSSADVSQVVAEVGDDASTVQISQDVLELADSASIVQISQLTIELGRGPEVIPPADNPVGTFTVGAGLGLDWYIALQLSDSGIELRDKAVKPVRITGKTTSGKVKVYGYGPKEDINVADIEDGIGQKAILILEDSAQVQQSKRHNVNVKNAMTHTVRVEGIWDGQGIPDRIDEIVYEVARQGIRR